jgi:hypothetical protein
MQIKKTTRVALMLVGVGLAASGRADDLAKLVKKAVERSTLNQPGTKPFHLKATLALSPSPHKDPNMTGEIEYWWISPSQFKREVRTPGFHQHCDHQGRPGVAGKRGRLFS